MLAVIFAVSYQSLHTFSHHHEIDLENYKTEKKTSCFSKNFSEKENCPICDFKFTSFLKSEIFSFNFYFPFKESPYSFSIKEASTFFCGSLFSHRGPPIN